MRKYKRPGAGKSIAAIGFIAAGLLVMVLSGCAEVKSNKDQGASMPPFKQVSGPNLLPMPEAGPQPATLASTGSIWGASSGSLCADLRASKIGDVLTITVSETSAASKASATSAQKAKTSTGSITFGGIGIGAAGVSSPKGSMSLGPYTTSFNNTFAGTGSTSQTDSMTTYMTATVIDVLPNGNLLIRGSRWTKVNDELQQIVLEGVVRPADISRLNTVLSQNVAEAKIFLLGKGPVAQSQKPGWLNQVIDFISPF
jgi:flagellar L-ring protein precursor FlgH